MGSTPVFSTPDPILMPEALLDILFPPVCPLCEEHLAEGPLCRDCRAGFSEAAITGTVCNLCGEPFSAGNTAPHACGRCLDSRPAFERARSVYHFEGAVLEAIHRFKYEWRMGLDGAISELVLEKVSSGGLGGADLVMPVPLHPSRLRERGFNQSLLVARKISRALGIGLDRVSLTRHRRTEAQVGLKPAEREKNVKGAFALKDPGAVRGRKVLLIDDVYTTGATVRECSKVLKKAGAEVEVLTIARAVRS